MKSINFLADIFNANWETWQDFVFILLIVLVAGFLLLMLSFILLNNARMAEDGERMAKKVARYEKIIEAKKKSLEFEKTKSEEELSKSREALQKKEQEATEAEKAADAARLELQKKEEEVKKAIESAEMTKKELAEYQKREKTNVSEDFALNAVTKRVLENSTFEMNKTIEDCPVPKALILDFTAKDINDYAAKKPKITFTPATGKKPATYKVEDKTFAMVYDLGEGKIRLTFKCGPGYGAKLVRNYGSYVSESKFPYGLLWFTLDNGKGCSLEMFKLLMDISYRIAKLGY